jgi:hypothetical protein
MPVYMIICDADVSPITGTGKYYVGKHSGSDPQKYLRKKLLDATNKSDIKRGYRSRLYNAMRKYPQQSDWRIHWVMPTLTTEVDSFMWETRLIALTNSQDHELGYNILPGGQGWRKGRVFTKEHKERLSLAHKGQRMGAEAKWGKPGEHKRMSDIAKAQIANEPLEIRRARCSAGGKAGCEKRWGTRRLKNAA